jgi:hypothetical protein
MPPQLSMLAVANDRRFKNTCGIRFLGEPPSEGEFAEIGRVPALTAPQW